MRVRSKVQTQLSCYLKGFISLQEGRTYCLFSAPSSPGDKKDADTLCICQKEHDTETLIVQKVVSSEWHWKANLALCSFFVLRCKDRWDQWFIIDHCYYLSWLTLIMWELHLHLHDCSIPSCGAILAIGCKGIALWDDTVGPCAFSSHHREQILDLLIQLEYKWPFLLLMHKAEQIPGCPSTVLEHFWNVATCVHPRAPACCLDRHHPFNTLKVELPR